MRGDDAYVHDTNIWITMQQAKVREECFEILDRRILIEIVLVDFKIFK